MENSADTPMGAATRENAAAASVDAVTEMTSRLTVGEDHANNARPIELDDAGGSVYRCKDCRTHLARADDIISKTPIQFSSDQTNLASLESDSSTPILELDDAQGNVYRCKHCRTHLAVTDDIISKGFYCKNGKAYLFDKVVNVTVGEKEDRMLITGKHTISYIFCVRCGVILGWKYEAAFERTQKYKEGKFILDREQLLGPE